MTEREGPLRAAVIETVGGHCGMNYYDFGLCGGLADAGVEVTLHTCDRTTVPPGLPFEVRRDFRGVYGDAPRWLRGLRYLLGLGRSLWAARRRGVAVVHYHVFHVTPLEALSGWLIQLAGFPLVVTAHDVEAFAGGEVPALARWLYRRAARVIAHNQVSQLELEAGLGVEPGRIRVVPHGNYLDQLGERSDRGEARAKLGLPATGPVLLFFGQIKRVKGLDLLVEALPAIVAEHPGARLVIAGRPWKDEFSAYRDRIRELGMTDHVLERIGYVPDEAVPRYFDAADLVVLPYRRIYQSGVLLQAMSYGRAVLVSDLPGMTEVLTSGSDGFVFASEDPADLSRQACLALGDEADLRAVARRARTTVEEGYGWGTIGARTEAVYREAVASGSHDARPEGP